MFRVGVIGYGYWGPNVVRNLCQTDGFEVAAICDRSALALRRAQQACPKARLTANEDEILHSSEIDVVAIVTPVFTHYQLAKGALQSGKHVFVEKPFTAQAHQAEELIELAEQKNLLIMVDHTFLFTGAVRKIRELISTNVLGDLYYYDSVRVNLGLFQHDVNVVWDLAPHDLSLIDHLIEGSPEALAATGQRHLNGHEDVAFITLYFPRGIIAHVNVNWLSPVKLRTTLIGGQKKMLVWNDLEPDEKIRIYDKGVQMNSTEDVRELLVSYRSGDVWSPRVEQGEALKAELSYFHKCISANTKPFNDGAAGWRVVKLLEAADASLRKRGGAVLLRDSGFVKTNRTPTVTALAA